MAYSRYSIFAPLALISVPLVLALGCGSSDSSEFTDGTGNGDQDGSPDGNGGFGPGGPTDGGPGTRPCEGLECQQKACAGGGTTSLTGTVFAPNGTLPLYNAIVYVPNAPVDAFPTTGVTCDKCGTSPSGKPIATALSGPDGKFTLNNVPAGDNIPLVIQIGKWRRQVVVPKVESCVSTPLDAGATRLPRNKTEGDIPKIALTTGSADSLECFFRKLGIDESEFSNNAGAGRIHLFNGVRRTGQCQRWDSDDAEWENRSFSECSANNYAEIKKAQWGGSTPANNDYRIAAVNEDGITGVKTPAATLAPATDLWGSTANGSAGFNCASNGLTVNKRCATSERTWAASPSHLLEYDMVVLSCEGNENNGTKDAASRAALLDYMNKGGRVFNSHFHYTWFKNPAENPLNATATWVGNSDRNDKTTRIDTSFAKGQAFGQWLVNASAATVDGQGNTNSDMKELRKNVTAVPASSRRWIYEPGDADAVKFYSFNLPLGTDAEAQCGRAVYTDIHVSSGDKSGGTFPDNCTTLNNGLSNQEKALLFLMMDLSSCIQDETKPPAPPPPVVK